MIRENELKIRPSTIRLTAGRIAGRVVCRSPPFTPTCDGPIDIPPLRHAHTMRAHISHLTKQIPGKHTLDAQGPYLLIGIRPPLRSTQEYEGYVSYIKRITRGRIRKKC